MSKTILITGANRGLGLESAKTLIGLGHQVIATGRNYDQLQKIKHEINSDLFDFVIMDINDDESVFEAFQSIKKQYKSIDVLINNAGIFIDSKDSMDVSVETIKQTFETNLFGPLRTSQIFSSLLHQANDGRIINISSGMGAFSEQMGGSAAYRLSKTALNSLTAIMHSDFNGGLTVVAACPGWVKTDMGGQSAPRSKSEGIAGIVDLALRENVKSGKFYRDGQEIDW